jgi:hypothetical protein
METNTVSTKDLEEVIQHRIAIMQHETAEAIKYHQIFLDLVKKLEDGKFK